MGRGYINVGIPPGLAREIRELLREEFLGYREIAEFIREAGREKLVRLIKMRGSRAGLREARQPEGA